MIRSVTFDFVAQKHEDAHLTVPVDVREALGLGADGWVYLDIHTASGRASGNFWMTSNGEVRVTKRSDDPNKTLTEVVPAGAWGIANASRATEAKKPPR